MTWQTVPLKRLASIRISNVDKKSVDGEPSVRLCNYTDVYYRNSIDPSQDFMRATASHEQVTAFRLKTGDVIITKDSETADDIGAPTYVEASAPDLVCGYHLALVRPLQEVVSGRFLFWAMASSLMRSQLEVAATGITRFGLRADAIGSATLALPPLPEQRAIADFLDAETARIDALIAKKQQLAALVEARFSRAVEVEVEHLTGRYGTIPVKRLTAVTVGIVIQPSRWYVEEGGVAALRGINIRPGYLNLNDLVRISEEGHSANAKSRLHEGDLVVVRTGDAGAAVVVPPFLDGANCIDLLVIRRSPGLESEFLRFVLNSGWSKRQITRGSVGTIQSHFNVESLRELPVPYAPLGVQRNLRRRLDAESARVNQIVSKLRQQLNLLAEHRQALITAAVTGRIEVPGAAIP